jgi:hypothetical protein
VAAFGVDQVAHVEHDRRSLGRQRGDELVDGDGARGHVGQLAAPRHDSPASAP